MSPLFVPIVDFSYTPVHDVTWCQGSPLQVQAASTANIYRTRSSESEKPWRVYGVRVYQLHVSESTFGDTRINVLYDFLHKVPVVFFRWDGAKFIWN